MEPINKLKQYTKHLPSCDKRTFNTKQKCKCGYNNFIKNFKILLSEHEELKQFATTVNETLKDKSSHTIIDTILYEASKKLVDKK